MAQITPQLIDTKPCLVGKIQRYKVGKFTVNIVIDEPWYKGQSFLSYAIDRTEKQVPGTMGTGSTEAEAVQESLQRWSDLIKPPTIEI